MEAKIGADVYFFLRRAYLNASIFLTGPHGLTRRIHFLTIYNKICIFAIIKGKAFYKFFDNRVNFGKQPQSDNKRQQIGICHKLKKGSKRAKKANKSEG